MVPLLPLAFRPPEPTVEANACTFGSLRMTSAMTFWCWIMSSRAIPCAPSVLPISKLLSPLGMNPLGTIVKR